MKLANFLLIALLGLIQNPVHAAIVSEKVTLSFPADFDEALWKGIDLETKTVLVEPKFDAPNWNLRFRQGYVSTNKALVGVFENTAFISEKTKAAPQDPDFYKPDHSYDPAGPGPLDMYNSVLMGWFRYHIFDHIMSPKPNTYILKTAAGNFSKIQFVDYVKNGKAMRWVKKKGLFGREYTELELQNVADQDGLVHLTLQYKYNTEPGNRALESN